MFIGTGVILCLCGIALLIYALNIKVEKDKNKLNQIIELDVELAEKKTLCEQYDNQIQQKKEEILKKKKSIKDELIQEQELAKQNLIFYKENLKYESDAYIESLKQIAEDREKEHNIKIQELEQEEDVIKNKIQKMKDSLAAGAKAQLREQEIKESLDFYKIKISKVDLLDIEKLNNLKVNLTKPIILSKLIWTTYYQKQTNELCARVLGSAQKCGIYKITNLITNQVYIGQSVNIAERWKQHIKYGLGIEASSTNRLYNSMQEYGVHNFTFEILEECSKEELNEKEYFWIDMYQTDSLGYNSNKGVTK